MALWDSAKRHAEPRYSHPWLAEAIFALDKRLRRHYAVLEYSAHPACIFRLEIVAARRALTLRDGTTLRSGARIARLHFWNEHIPPVPPRGATIRWARQMQKAISTSLRELARFLSSRGDLSDISVICGDVPSATRAHWRQVETIMAHYGFETIMESAPLPIGEQIHRLGENVLISLTVLAQNARALRLDTLRRARVPIYL
ncbi:MAG: hypothetical protein WBF58_16105, partial [Xanthobacteraceae bacterium]